MTPKRIFIFIGFLFMTFICIDYFARHSYVGVEEEIYLRNEVEQKVSVEAAEVVRDAAYEKDLAERMAKKGIIITLDSDEPETEAQWEFKLRSDLEKLKVFELENANQAISEMQTTPEEYKEKMSTIDEHIDIVKKQLEESPYEERSLEMLKGLYQLKALGKILKEKGVTSFSNTQNVHEVVTPNL